MAGNFSVTQFKEAVAQSGGFARPIFFECSITCGILPGQQLKPDDHFFCKATNIPEETIETIDVKYFTRPVSIPGARQYQPLTVTFYNTTNYQLRNYFVAWLGAFNERKENRRSTAAIQAITGTVELKHYNNNGRFKFSGQAVAQLAASAASSNTNRLVSTIGRAAGNSVGSTESNNPLIHNFKFINAFPTSVGQLNFSHEDDTAVQTFDVTFKYLRMESESPDVKPDRNILDKITNVLSGRFKVGK